MGAAILGDLPGQGGNISVSILTGLEAWWRCHETDEGDRLDSTGNGWTLSPQVGTVGSGTGLFGDVAALVGGTGYLKGTNGIVNSGAISLAVWANTIVNDRTQFIISRGTTASFYISMTDSAIVFNIKGSAPAVTISITGTPTTDHWYHLVGTYDGTIAKFYIDGTLAGQATGSASYAGADRFGLGGTPDLGDLGSSIFNGLFQGAGVWSKALNQAEVNYLFNDGAGRDII